MSFSPDASRSPVHTLSTHRGPIKQLLCGHSSSIGNIAISISQDKSAMIWDYHSGQALRTYLLPEVPTAVTLDPADRAFYVAYEDGSLHTISFYDEMQQTTPVDILRDASQSHRPIQPPTKTRFNAESQKLGGALSLALSWDGTTLLSGHESGKVVVWDIAKSYYVSTLASLPGPVTNLQFLDPAGFPDTQEAKFKLHTVVKPKQDSGLSNSGSGLVPANYTLNMQFTGRLGTSPVSATEKKREGPTEFEAALTHPCFPLSMLEESLAELETWNAPSTGAGVAPAADYLSLSADDTAKVAQGTSATSGKAREDEVAELKKQLASQARILKAAFSEASELREERDWLLKEKKRAQQKQGNAKKVVNGDVEMSEGSSSEEGSSASESNDSDDSSEEEESDEASSSE